MSRSSRLRVPPSNRARAAKRESKYIDFKEQFNPTSDGEWCELLKDFAAMANSGGGIIIFGLRNNGATSGADVRPILDLDPAEITDKLFKYTGVNHAGFEVYEVMRNEERLAVIAVEAVAVPIVFTRPGTYLVGGTVKQRTAFSQGTVYFRHGAKSEPATSDDLRDFIDRQIVAAREAWLGNVRKVVESPADAEVAIYRLSSPEQSSQPTRIQLTTDPNAPVYGRLDPDESHPYRQKELVSEVNRRLPGTTKINAYDIKCVRKTQGIDATTSPQFCHLPKFGTTQYSEPFVEWLVDRFKTDKTFFRTARSRFYESTHSVD